MKGNERKISVIKGSPRVTIPPALAAQIGIKAGMNARWIVNGRQLILEPIIEKIFTYGDLVNMVEQMIPGRRYTWISQMSLFSQLTSMVDENGFLVWETDKQLPWGRLMGIPLYRVYKTSGLELVDVGKSDE
jgi:antitoxin component of MazEF toxin-antitoxin module